MEIFAGIVTIMLFLIAWVLWGFYEDIQALHERIDRLYDNLYPEDKNDGK